MGLTAITKLFLVGDRGEGGKVNGPTKIKITKFFKWQADQGQTQSLKVTLPVPIFILNIKNNDIDQGFTNL